MGNPSKANSLLADASNNPLLGAQQTNVTDAKVDYEGGTGADSLDTDTKRATAMNATNGKINSILGILEAHGLMAE